MKRIENDRRLLLGIIAFMTLIMIIKILSDVYH
jgi:hypothetical protein